MVFGQAVEDYKKQTGKDADNVPEMVNALKEVIEFIALRPINSEFRDSFSSQINTKIRFIYIHTGVSSMSKGGLRLISKAIVKVPKEI